MITANYAYTNQHAGCQSQVFLLCWRTSFQTSPVAYWQHPASPPCPVCETALRLTPHLSLGLRRVGGRRLNPCFVLHNNNPYWCLFWQVFHTALKWGHRLAGKGKLLHGETVSAGCWSAPRLPSVFPREWEASWSESSGSIAHGCSRVCFPVRAARASRGLVTAASSPGGGRLRSCHLHWGATAPAVLPAHPRGTGKEGKKLQEQKQFLNGPLPVLLHCHSLYLGCSPTLEVNCSWDPEGTRFLSPGFKLLQKTPHPLRSICIYNREEPQ